jgi:hypothetical protein
MSGHRCTSSRTAYTICILNLQITRPAARVDDRSGQARDARQNPLLLHHGLDLLWRTRQEGGEVLDACAPSAAMDASASATSKMNRVIGRL